MTTDTDRAFNNAFIGTHADDYESIRSFYLTILSMRYEIRTALKDREELIKEIEDEKLNDNEKVTMYKNNKKHFVICNKSYNAAIAAVLRKMRGE